jgi:hypothetical protein
MSPSPYLLGPWLSQQVEFMEMERETTMNKIQELPTINERMEIIDGLLCALEAEIQQLTDYKQHLQLLTLKLEDELEGYPTSTHMHQTLTPTSPTTC